MLHHADDVPWSAATELRAWTGVARRGVDACRPGAGDDALARRGAFVKDLAQRAGFVTTYWNPRERARW